ncbi:hypothetical protein AGMMS50249_1260 [candidate division SR1 bacterium]|nr:hypothetical protein AGMMS50249_1260 [candidate division SR1 bacterium]
MSFQNLTDLYEVRKTVRFELKPSKITETFLQKEGIYTTPTNILFRNKEIEKDINYSKEVGKKIDENQFTKTSKSILEYLIIFKGVLNANIGGQIFVKRDIFEAIDKVFYIHLKKTTKLSGTRGIGFAELKKHSQNGVEKLLNYFDEVMRNIENLQIDLEDIGKSAISLSKTDIKKTLRSISLEYIRVHNFLEKFDVGNDKFDEEIKEKIENILKFEVFFKEAKGYYFMSENQSSGILMRRFGFNEKALKRRQPQEIKDDLKTLRPDFEKEENKKHTKEQERQKLIEEFELRTKQEHFPDLLHPEKWEYIAKKDKDERTEDEQNYRSEIGKQKKNVKDLRENDESIKKLTNELNQIRKEWGNLKRNINNKEKELENNLALTHYAKLLKKTECGEISYYLILIPVVDKNILDISIGKNGDIDILEYRTLTFGAFSKLALSYDGTMGGYFDKNLSKFIVKDQPDEKDFKDLIEYKKCEVENKNTKWFYEKKFNEKFQNYQKSPFEKLKKYIENVISNNEDVFGYISFDFQRLWKIDNLIEYIVEFNKQGYNVNWEKINFSRVQDLEKEEKLELYQIYCKDFCKDQDFFEIEHDIEEQKRKRFENKETGPKNPNLFTIYWQDFIKDIENGNQNIRLNSDSGYFVKKADENITEKVLGKSRKKRDKIIGSFNLSFNSDKRLTNSFEEKENISKFNETYNEKVQPKNELTYIGLDRGEKELLTYCIIDKDGNCIKTENGEYLIGDFNLINSKGEFVKKEDCKWKDESGKEYKDLIGGSLKVGNFKNNEYFEVNNGAKLYYNKAENGGFRIEAKDGKKIKLEDKSGNKVYDYNLIFKLAILRRQIMNQKGEITLNDIQEMRGGYISQIIRMLNEWIVKYNGVLVLENLGRKQEKDGEEIETNKDKILKKNFGVTIYQEIETLLNRKYNYFVKKDDTLTLQLTPKVKNIGDIKISEKENVDLNLGNIVFVNEFNTSKECPVCGKELYGHLTKWEEEMHHYDENNGIDYGREIDKAKNTKNSQCDYNMKTNNHGFDFIHSGDDLAAYNIAKRGLEFLKSGQIKNQIQQTQQTRPVESEKELMHKDFSSYLNNQTSFEQTPFANLPKNL